MRPPTAPRTSIWSSARSRAAGAARVSRFVLVSSVGVYGFPSRLPVTEEHPYAPRTAVLRDEGRGRDAGSPHGERGRASSSSSRAPPSSTVPGDRNGMLDKMAVMIRAGAYRIVGAGDNLLAPHARRRHRRGPVAHGDPPRGRGRALHPRRARDDHARASVRARGPRGRAATATRARPSALARAVATVVDVAAYRGVAFTSREPPVNHEKLDVMTLPIWFDVAKARRLLGFAPRVGYEEGVLRTLRGEWPAAGACRGHAVDEAPPPGQAPVVGSGAGCARRSSRGSFPCATGAGTRMRRRPRRSS